MRNVRNDDPIWRTRLRLTGPAEIEAYAESWVASAAAAAITAHFTFWTVYGLSTPVVGAGWAIATAILTTLIAAPGVAIIVGVIAGRWITPDTPASYWVRVVVSEFRAPQRRPEKGGRERRRRIPQPPEQLAAPRRAIVALPAHINEESVCVRPECLEESSERGDVRASQP